MIEVLDWRGRNCLRVNAIGKLAAADFGEVWIPRLEEVLAEPWHGRCLLSMDEGFQGWTLGAI